MNKNLRLYRDHLPTCTQGSALSIGNFDGVHLGHQTLLKHVAQVAHNRQLVPTVLTFFPHVREFFARQQQRPELAPTRILSIRDKITAIAQCGIECIVAPRFNQAFANISPNEFIERILIKSLNIRWLTVGEDFRFGHKRMGDITLLQEAAKHYDFELEIVNNVLSPDQRRYASTDLRQALALGDVKTAQQMLGRPYYHTGHVIHGKKLGRELGFPTLNIKLNHHCALRSGIYIVKVDGLADKPLAGIASLGVRPTVDYNGQVLLEVHVLDKTLSAYGKLIQVSFLEYVRDEVKFPDLDTLVAAIDADVIAARTYFEHYGL